MGGSQSQTGPDNGKQEIQTTVAPAVPSAPCPSNNQEFHLVLAFLAGILLTLLLTALVFLVVKSCRKCHSRPQALDFYSDSPAKPPSGPEEAPTSVSEASKLSEERKDPLIVNHSEDSNSVVYAQVKVTNSPHVPSKD